MNQTGYYAEYFIVGSFSLVSAFATFSRLGIEIPGESMVWILVTPSLYVLGMLIDVIGHYLTLPHRRLIRSRAKERYTERYGMPLTSLTTIEFESPSTSPDISRALNLRARARIARGVLTNTLLGVVAYAAACFVMAGITVAAAIQVGIGFVLALILWLLWARLQRLVYKFEFKARANADNLPALKTEPLTGSEERTRTMDVTV